ncbi:hypothetical protein SLA2020_080490 [Shorea laevis]
MVKSIFEKRVVEKNDMGTTMRFPGDAKTNYLPSACSNGGLQLLVEDEKGAQWKLTCKKKNGKTCFTDGWEKFRDERRIGIGHKISFYQDDDDSGSGAQYKITVMEN